MKKKVSYRNREIKKGIESRNKVTNNEILKKVSETKHTNKNKQKNADRNCQGKQNNESVRRRESEMRPNNPSGRQQGQELVGCDSIQVQRFSPESQQD